MSVASILIITIIVALSIAAVFIAEDPIEEVFHIEAFLRGFPLAPLATKITARKPAPRTTAPRSSMTQKSVQSS